MKQSSQELARMKTRSSWSAKTPPVRVESDGMPVIIVAIAVPALVLGLYAWGRWIYGDKYYVAFGKASTAGNSDPLRAEIENESTTRLDLSTRGND